MPQGTCTVEGCERANFAKGYCTAHYFRIRRQGQAGQAKPLNASGVTQCLHAACSGPSIAYGYCRSHVIDYVGFAGTATGCHEWSGSRTAGGYGLVGNTKRVRVHRLSWELANGSTIPDGMVIRHKCDNPPCINPEHLEIGTHADNMADMFSRGRRPMVYAPKGNAGLAATRDSCKRGHDLTTPDAVYRWTYNGRQRASCAQCRRESDARHYASRRHS